jgi:hypothetical protein
VLLLPLFTELPRGFSPDPLASEFPNVVAPALLALLTGEGTELELTRV